jgi:hypothetical protein
LYGTIKKSTAIRKVHKIGLRYIKVYFRKPKTVKRDRLIRLLRSDLNLEAYIFRTKKVSKTSLKGLSLYFLCSYTYITGELEEETSVRFRRPSIDPREERLIPVSERKL